MEIPEFFHGNYCSQISAEMHQSVDSSKTMNDHFIVEELLDFSNEDDAVLTDCGGAAAAFDNVTGNNSSESSTVTVVDSCNSGCEPTFPGDKAGHFSSDLCVPYDDLAELEWVSNFVEESFSCEDMQKLQLISGMKAGRSDETSETRQFQTGNDVVIDNDSNSIDGNNTIFNPEMAVPGKARSKRSRAAPCNWASRLLMLSPTTSSLSEITTTEGIIPTVGPTLPSLVHGKKSGRGTGGGNSKKKDCGDEGNNNVEGRKCLHCATDKTPQWRTGPMGPKTLCNACGVRYKSGRLVPEYRPAASPTFVLTKHSNSHRKVMELRRQKEMQRAQQQQQPFMHHHELHRHHHHHQNVMFDLSNGDDYLIHGHGGPDFRQLI